MTALTYIKEGRSRRLERERGTTCEITLQERGQAIENDGLFECTTLPGETPVDRSAITPIPRDLTDTLRGMNDELERATVITGAAHHQIKAQDDDRTWRDAAVRVHVSIVSSRSRLRCELDRGGHRFEPSWSEELVVIRDALYGCRTDVAISGPVCLEPSVSAAIIASAWRWNVRERLRLVQAPRSKELDGYGQRIEERRLDLHDLPDTWFRPSYRARPRQIPHGLDLTDEPSGSGTPATSAIALIGVTRLEGDHLLVPCLLRGGEGPAAATVHLDLRRWDDQVEVISTRQEWFPYLAGVWGRRLVFRGRISPLEPFAGS